MKLYSLTYFRFLITLMVAVLSPVVVSTAAWAESIYPAAIAGSTSTLKNIGLNFDLASAPTVRLTVPTAASKIPVQSSLTGTVPPPPLSVQTVKGVDSTAEHPQTVAIGFDFPKQTTRLPSASVAVVPSDDHSSNPRIPVTQAIDTSALFKGDSNSLVAKAVGSAEGTRTPEGERNPAYYGHVDPGNGAWNLGSFSYQHGASSPEEADTKQLKRLQTQAATLQSKAQTQGLELTLEQQLNGIDLANQAPKAALERGGYIDRLLQAQQMGLQDPDAVLWARTRAFLDPDTQQWNAPGLGNNVYSIMHDQQRRQRAIARAIAAYQRQLETPGASPLAIQKATEDRLMAQNTVIPTDSFQSGSSAPESSAPRSSMIDRLLHLDLSTANALQ